MGTFSHVRVAGLSVDARFWAKVDKNSSPHGCWLWTASLHPRGYGMFNCQDQNIKAHRVAWLLEHGFIPKGLSVLHSCEHLYVPEDITCRRCVRHLYLGTQGDNIRDMHRTGRCDRSGSRNGRAKLTYDQAEEIRQQYAGSKAALARQYGVSGTAISYILQGKTWVK
jgi:hypothetical protein